MPTNTSSDSGVPASLALLLIQFAGGALTLFAIWDVRGTNYIDAGAYQVAFYGAIFNVVLSLVLLICELRKHRMHQRASLSAAESIARTPGQMVVRGSGGYSARNRNYELSLVRTFIIYDSIMLGVLVLLTGGAQQSLFAPQFAALLPVAILVPDKKEWKWAYAFVFLFMFMVGFRAPFPLADKSKWAADRQLQQDVWFMLYFFLYTLFPVVYSILSSREQHGSETPSGGQALIHGAAPAGQ